MGFKYRHIPVLKFNTTDKTKLHHMQEVPRTLIFISDPLLNIVKFFKGVLPKDHATFTGPSYD